ncbi:MAG: ABC transporter permease [Candidatus Woesearchaeota archaeon]
MKKIIKIVGKNLKLLMRSKTSILVVIFGPLLIMLLVGFAFNNPTASKLNIGYVAPEKTNLTNEFLNALKSNTNFAVIEYVTTESCTDMIEQGNAHVCIIFPKDFAISNNKTNEIVFYVDQSRTNFIYAVIETVSSKIDFTSNKLSYQMTNDLISTIESAKKTNSENLLRIIKLKAATDDLTKTLTDMQTKLGSLDLNKSSLSTGNADTQLTAVETDVAALKSKGLAIISASEDFLDDVTVDNSSRQNVFEDELETYRAQITNQSNKTNADVAALKSSIAAMSTDVDKLNKKLDTVKTTTADTTTKITAMKTNLAEIKTNLESMKSSVETLNAQINAIKVTSAESIVNPITTTIKPVSTKSNNLNFIFPYLIILIIVFISIMLSSNLIIMEKTSKAYFRNFTTPTKDLTFIISTFLTSIFVNILQLILILLLAYYFLEAGLSTNIGFTVLLIFVSIALFTIIGMIIGYFFKSQEAVTMASISVGSVFLFLSNLVLPVENMSLAVQKIAHYNPYVIASETLKKITIFNAKWPDIQMDFAFLAGYIIIGIILVLIIQKMSKIQYISKKPMKHLLKKDDIVDKYLKLNSGVLVRYEAELLEELKKMSDTSFNEYVTKTKNDFESWLILNNRNALAKKVGECKTREETIKVLEKSGKK